MAVFTKEWVRRNLSQFLDGATASPIVTLGEEAIESKEQERELTQQIEELRAKATDADRKRKDHASKAKKLATAAQGAISDQLREFDSQRFTKNKYSQPVVEGKLRDYKGEFSDENAHAEALKRLGEGAAERVTIVPEPPKPPAAALTNLEALLAETPSRIALEALATDQGRQAWVEEGMSLHEHLDECLFCASVITFERREQLAKHFGRSWFEIRERTRASAHFETQHQAINKGLEGDHFRRQSSKWNDCLQGENQLWVQRVGSSHLSLSPRP
jgi:wobble nucleotide-excising tRNase